MCQMKNQNKAKKLGKQQWCLYLPPVNRLVEIPWIENNVINSVITRDQWIEHHSWPSRNNWNPSWLRHSGISIISWRSLVVFNFHWSLGLPPFRSNAWLNSVQEKFVWWISVQKIMSMMELSPKDAIYDGIQSKLWWILVQEISV